MLFIKHRPDCWYKLKVARITRWRVQFLEWMQNPKWSFHHETKTPLRWKWKQWHTLPVEVKLLQKYIPVKLTLLLLSRTYLHIVLFGHSECILYHNWWNECSEMILWCCHSVDLAGNHVCSPDIHWCLRQIWVITVSNSSTFSKHW